ncbi:MAG: CpsD/CapB family tyrosine-protein kinase [Acidimicrobiales bacterium]
MKSFNEAFRMLCSNVSAALDQLGSPVVAVTSSKVGEGKTVTCVKLGASFAARGQRVVVVDLDLRDPGAHAAVGGHNRVGVTDVLQGRRKLGDCLQYVKLPDREGFAERGLFLVAAGPSVLEPNELLGLPRAERMLTSLATEADVVLVDTPPVLAVADTLTIGRTVGGAILVIDPRRTNAASVQRARDLLLRNETKVLGMVLNQVHASDAGVSAADGYGYGASDSAPG